MGGIDEVQACTTFTFIGVTFTNLCTSDIPDPDPVDCQVTGTPTTFGENGVKCWAPTLYAHPFSLSYGDLVVT